MGVVFFFNFKNKHKLLKENNLNKHNKKITMSNDSNQIYSSSVNLLLFTFVLNS